jgi:type IV pilus assembly protein PilX
MHRPDTRSSRQQQGVSLIFALITLVVIGLATLALVRTVDNGSLILGNMSFKQDATASADQAVRTAFVWLKSQSGSTLGADSTANGYYASSHDTDSTQPVDVTGQQYPSVAARQLIEWYPNDSKLKNCAYTGTGNCSLVSVSAGTTPNGNNSLRYTIFRLCGMTDAAAGGNNNCATPSGLGGGNHEAGVHTPTTATSGHFYRIVVQVSGSRNSTSFVEAIVQL